MKNQAKTVIESIRNEAKRIHGKPMSNSMLAKSLGVSSGSVSNWKAGRDKPTEENLKKLNGLLNTLRALKPANVAQGALVLSGAVSGFVKGRTAAEATIGDNRNGHANGVVAVNRVATIMDEMKNQSEHEDDLDDDSDSSISDEFNEEPSISVSEHYAIGLAEAPVTPTPTIRDQIGATIKQQIRTLKIKPTSSLTVEFRRDESAPHGVKATCAFFADISIEALEHILKNHNVHNRDANQKHARQIAGDMRRGHFELTGETIIFDEDLQVADAQHRLLAAHSLGKTLHGLIVIGVSRRVARVINSARIRSVRDRLVCAGRPFAATRSNVLKLLNRVDKSLDLQDGEQDLVDNSAKSVQFHGPTAFELERHYSSSLDLEQAIEYVHGLRWKIKGDLPRHVGAVFYMFAAQKSPAAAHFLRLVVDGGAPADSPILATRETLVALAKKKAHGADKTAKQRTGQQIKSLCLGWNAFCAGRKNEIGRLLNRSRLTSSQLLGTLDQPKDAIAAEAMAETPEESVLSVRGRARDLAQREIDNRRSRASDVDGFSESIRRSMEAS